ncbi:MAG: tyrosine-type recombinase/integrase [Butyrivibrio sp.]|uniref:tyrosine-type recombinase/integrase n=1 Tax=Butyrivibrio sp. TaxID=28121 RepID=UPI001B4D7430|nr:tyrosine-type recombinase/integrase [Butyrivibrio sp.]MBP3782754.1 tyrosine-type recombinase/integrase [Butyrivibrio sp.]
MSKRSNQFNNEMSNVVRVSTKEMNETILSLTTLCKRGIIPVCDVSEKIDDAIMKKELAILEKHKEFCGIWQSEGDKRWRTKVPDATKKDGRKLIAKSTKEDLEKSIVEHYESIYGVKQSLSTIFKDWIISKEHSSSLNNAKKIKYVWDKYYQDSSISKKPLEELNVGNIEDFLYAQLSANELTMKQYNEMKSVINCMLDYAVDHDYIPINRARSVPRPSKNKFRVPPQKPLEEIVYTDETMLDAIDRAEELFKSTGNTAYLAVCLNFSLGLRVGELVALETTDIRGSIIHVGKEELHTIIKEGDKYKKQGTSVVNHTKTTCGERELPLTPEGMEFINMALDYNKEHGFKDNEFIFLDRYGHRIRSECVEYALRNINGTRNERDGFDIVGRPSGNHAIRRTYLSILHENGVADGQLKNSAGHKHISTTQDCYIYSRKPVEDYVEIYANALSRKRIAKDFKDCNPSVTQKNKDKEKRQVG